jgi:hypothetical protein
VPSLFGGGGNDVKSVRSENQFLRRTAAHKLLSDPIALGSDYSKFTRKHRVFIKKQQVLQAEGLLPVLLLHDLGAQIADSIDNARKRGAHLGLKVAIVEATLFKRTFRRFDA